MIAETNVYILSFIWEPEEPISVSVFELKFSSFSLINNLNIFLLNT